MEKLLLFGAIALSLNGFRQAPGGGVNDADGNTYETVIIGSQEWMSENLKTSKYSDCTDIGEVNSSEWMNLTSPAWTYYEDNSLNNTDFGKLYNWYVVDAAKNVCPSGWHVPTRQDADI